MTYQSIQSFLISVFTMLFIAYVLIGILLYIKQRDFLYFPTEVIKTDYLQKIFSINGEKIHSTIINPKKQHAIIYFGGNAGTVDYNVEQFSKLKEHTSYLVKYRGYSGSSGEPTEEGLYADALAIYDEIQSEYKSISIIGRSLGSGVATWLTSQREVEKLVLVTPYDSITNVAQERFSLYPVFLIIKDKYDSISSIKSINTATLILIAQNDTMISYARSQALVEASKNPKVVIIPNTTHNSISDTTEYQQILQSFLEAREL